ncbi:MAG TPA: DUF3592 domain-containing protein [Pseudolabrys sp.]|nr:DUF3592 domain-containing protein [Pseudolabrys sp.]
METTPKIAADRNKRGSLAFGRNLIVLGTIIFLPGLWGAAHGVLTLRWPRAEAKIIDASLRTFSNDSNERKRRDEWHSFAVHYTYNVAGRDYFSGRVEPYDFGMQNSAGADQMRDRHPVGSTASIAYSPDDPSLAYLEPGPSSFSLLMIGIGGFMALTGLWIRGLARRGIGRMET